jgi:hypothetical protein
MKGHFLFAGAMLTVTLTALPSLAQQRTFLRPLGDEQSLKVSLESRVGSIHIRRTQTGNLYLLHRAEQDGGAPQPRVIYSVRDGRGYLSVTLSAADEDDNVGKLFRASPANDWTLELTDRIPLQLSVKMGAGSSDLDFTGLRLSLLSLESGAGDIGMRVRTPNPEALQAATISAGIGSIRASGLGNLNYRSFRFDGGIGSYMLDMTGAYPERSSFAADVGMGSLAIILPSGLGVRLESNDSFLSSTSYPGFKELDDDRYETPSYRTAPKKLLMTIDSGVGSVAISWK